MSGLFVDVEYGDGRNPLSEPALITCSVPGLCDTEAVFTEHNHGNRHVFRAGNDFEGGRIVVGSGRQCVRIQNQRRVRQRHIPGSIFSESSSIRRLIRAFSLRKCFSLPMCLTQGFSEAFASDASLSLTASVTNSRKGIPRSAATDLARRKMGSGISNVVFIGVILPYLWDRVNRSRNLIGTVLRRLSIPLCLANCYAGSDTIRSELHDDVGGTSEGNHAGVAIKSSAGQRGWSTTRILCISCAKMPPSGPIF